MEDPKQEEAADEQPTSEVVAVDTELAVEEAAEPAAEFDVFFSEEEAEEAAGDLLVEAPKGPAHGSHDAAMSGLQTDPSGWVPPALAK